MTTTTADAQTTALRDLIDSAEMLGFDAALYSDNLANRAWALRPQLEATIELVAQDSEIAGTGATFLGAIVADDTAFVWDIIEAARNVLAALRAELSELRRKR